MVNNLIFHLLQFFCKNAKVKSIFQYLFSLSLIFQGVSMYLSSDMYPKNTLPLHFVSIRKYSSCIKVSIWAAFFACFLFLTHQCQRIGKMDFLSWEIAYLTSSLKYGGRDPCRSKILSYWPSVIGFCKKCIFWWK